MLKLSGIYIYPIKSTHAITLSNATVEARGLQGDRRYMLVDPLREFITARQYPILTQVRTTWLDSGLLLQAPGQQALSVESADSQATGPTVQIWESPCAAVDRGDAAAIWFSQLLGTKVRLVEMTKSCLRRVDPAYGQESDSVSFADGYPLLLTTEESLADLQQRCPEPISMARFRPNLVLSGAPAYAEDDWQHITISGIRFEVVKACVRCVFTTLDPASGARSPNQEPLRTLATYRRSPQGGVYFGQNLIPRGLSQGTDTLSLGAEVKVSHASSSQK